MTTREEKASENRCSPVFLGSLPGGSLLPAKHRTGNPSMKGEVYLEPPQTCYVPSTRSPSAECCQDKMLSKHTGTLELF